MTLAALVAIASTSCVLTESKHYVVQDAPPTGVHVTIRHHSGFLLRTLSDLVRKGVAADKVLRDNGYDVRCDHYANTTANGDRCAFRVLQATPVSGGLVQSLANRLYWQAAIDPTELDDFRADTMAKLRADHARCPHVTIHNYGGTPYPVRSANWTYRPTSDRYCP